MPRYHLLLISLLFSTQGFAQRYTSRQADVSFFSDAVVEDITAHNTKATAIFDPSAANIAFVIPITDFQFEKALMQEHFNEKYMESDKFPKATFQGKLEGFQTSSTAAQNVTARGKMTIHGVTKDVAIPGTITMAGNKSEIKSKFIVKLEDYKIAIPKMMWQKIAEQVEVSVSFTLAP